MCINKLKSVFGNRCTGVKINDEFSFPVNIPRKRMRFCEAVKHSFKVPLQINMENLGCQGAWRSIGYNKDDEWLANYICEKDNLPLSFVTSSLARIPKLENVQNITLGILEEMEKENKPDMYIVYTSPAKITGLMMNYAREGNVMSVSPYFQLSVCGNILANTIIHRTLSVSFGCPESRQAGGVDEDEIILGIPGEYVNTIISLYE